MELDVQMPVYMVLHKLHMLIYLVFIAKRESLYVIILSCHLFYVISSHFCPAPVKMLTCFVCVVCVSLSVSLDNVSVSPLAWPCEFPLPYVSLFPGFDISSIKRDPLPAEQLLRGLNYHMRHEHVRIIGCQAVPNEFHARFSATSRSYVYRLVQGTEHSPLFLDKRVWALKDRAPLDVDAMREAASHLVGSHDFSAFRSSACQVSSC
jgi:hypothetical protein